MQFKSVFVLSFVLPLLCVPLLMIGLVGATRAGDAKPKTACVEGGTYCPARTDEADCPEPWSDNNYYCNLAPQPTYCDGESEGSCLDITPTNGGAANDYPCGREYSCKSGQSVYDSTGTTLIYCSQVPSKCEAGS